MAGLAYAVVASCILQLIVAKKAVVRSIPGKLAANMDGRFYSISKQDKQSKSYQLTQMGASEDQAVLAGNNVTLDFNAEFIATLADLPPIPKKIHVIWPDKNVVNSKTDMVKNGLRKMIDLNPKWEVVIHEYADIDKRLQESTMHSPEDKKLLANSHIVERTDAFRLLLIYEEGGYYQDMDRVYNVPLDDVVTPNTRMLLPTFGDLDFAQDILCTAPGNPILKQLIEKQSSIRLHGPCEGVEKDKPCARIDGWVRVEDVIRMGPGLNFGIMSQVMFGRKLFGRADHPTRPKPAVSGLDVVAARQAIRAQWPLLVTKKERPESCDWLMATPIADCSEAGFTYPNYTARKSLYDEYSIAPWWQAVGTKWYCAPPSGGGTHPC